MHHITSLARHLPVLRVHGSAVVTHSARWHGQGTQPRPVLGRPHPSISTDVNGQSEEACSVCTVSSAPVVLVTRLLLLLEVLSLKQTSGWCHCPPAAAAQLSMCSPQVLVGSDEERSGCGTSQPGNKGDFTETKQSSIGETTTQPS